MRPILRAGERVLDAVSGLPDWLAVLTILASSVVVAKVIEAWGRVAIHRVTDSIEGDVDDAILETLHLPLYVSVILAGAYLAMLTLDPGRAMAASIHAGVLSVLTVLWAYALTRLGRRVSSEVTSSEQFDQKVVPIFQNVWTAVLLGGSLFLLLSYWNVDVTPLLASAGIIGIVVGFAARDTIANFFGSIALYFDGTYAVGDFVILETGERGRVEDISIRSTVIRTRDDVLVTVPNSVLNSARITNESAPRRRRRIRIPVAVAYGTDVDRLEEVLMGVAGDTELVLDQPRPRVRFRGFGDSALEFELLCWIQDPVLRGRATHDLHRAVYAAFDREGIVIPFPQREVRLASPGDELAG